MSFWQSLKKDLEVAPAGYWLVVDDASPEQIESEIATLGWTYLGEITSAEAITAAAKRRRPVRCWRTYQPRSGRAWRNLGHRRQTNCSS